MPYQVLLIDDDPRITANLLEWIDWNALGYAQPQIARNAADALERVASSHIDVVLTDLSMPDINGLELIKKIQAVSIHTEFVILSGYGTFDYAREAIALRVRYFLTKPTDLGEVTEAFDRLRESLDQKRQSAQQAHMQASAVSSTLTNALDRMFADLRSGGSSPASMKYLLIQHDERFTQGLYALMRIRLSGTLETLESSVQQMNLLIQLIARRLGVRIYCIPSSNHNFYVFLNFDDPAVIERLADELAEAYLAIGGSELNCGISAICQSVGELDGCFQQADSALLSAVYQKKRLCHSVACAPEQPCTAEELENRLVALLENSLFSDAMTEVDELLGDDLSVDEAVKLLLAVGARMRANGEKVVLRWNGGSMPPPYELKTAQEIRRWFISGLEQLHKVVSEDSTSLNIRNIDRAKRYIHENYMEDISLERVSRHVNMSPNYFSSVFKNVTGIHFVDYVVSVRINKALELLMDDHIPIYSICEKVGYSNPRYFSQVFRAAIGCTPTQFRQKNGTSKKR